MIITFDMLQLEHVMMKITGKGIYKLCMVSTLVFDTRIEITSKSLTIKSYHILDIFQVVHVTMHCYS